MRSLFFVIVGLVTALVSGQGVLGAAPQREGAEYSAPLAPQAASWTRLVATNAPPPGRRDAALVYDAVRQRVILFGGRQGNQPLDDTWAFDLGTRRWEVLIPEGAARPPARFSMVAGVDRGRQQMLISTGEAGAGRFFNDVWRLDLTTDRWEEVTPAGAAPEVRYGAAGGIAGVNGSQLYVTHGFTSQGRFDDTWAFDLATETWADVTPSGTLPEKRCLHAAAVGMDGALVLFGGCSSGFGPCPQDDTWRFDPSAGVWEQLATGPSARIFPGLAPLDGRNQMLLFGGQGSGNADLDDSWLLDGETGRWSQLTLTGERPSARHGHAMVWLDEAAADQPGGVLVFGGRQGGSDLNDLWLFTPEAVTPASYMQFLPLVTVRAAPRAALEVPGH